MYYKEIEPHIWKPFYNDGRFLETTSTICIEYPPYINETFHIGDVSDELGNSIRLNPLFMKWENIHGKITYYYFDYRNVRDDRLMLERIIDEKQLDDTYDISSKGWPEYVPTFISMDGVKIYKGKSIVVGMKHLWQNTYLFVKCKINDFISYDNTDRTAFREMYEYHFKETFRKSKLILKKYPIFDRPLSEQEQLELSIILLKQLSK